MNSIYNTNDINMLFEMINRRMNGLVDDDEWKAFETWVKETSAKSTQNKLLKCLDCFDLGYIWKEKEDTDYMYVYRCDCLTGHSKESYLPIYRKPHKPNTKAIIYE